MSIQSRTVVMGTFCLLFAFTGGLSEARGNSVDSSAITAAHNQWRSKTRVPSLAWSTTLAANAQRWATQLAQSGCNMKHSTTSYGENIFWAGPLSYSNGTSKVQDITDQNVVDSWGDEIENYDYGSNSCHGVCGHYTQVVWKSTKEVGCGMAVCSDKGQIWVCQYNPPGNMAGQKPY
ncbi:MAG: CAP domain-containing protein [Candidatus Electrothrix aestuarii]|uniref:CAP domain-containing protein n=1 Tax=Candidatus Electrothrix aestuarii TaxID=3062594 RepID=A0AAU8M0I6_9BACT